MAKCECYINKLVLVIILFVTIVEFAQLNATRMKRKTPEKSTTKILYPFSELVIDAMDNLNLTCEADQPIIWLDPKMNNIDDISSDIFVKYEISTRKTFLATLHITHASYSYTGFYYCDFSNTTQKDNYNTSSSIYVYVKDETHLLVDEELLFLHGHQYQDLLIPCKPTFPAVHVVLYKDNKEADNEINYDPKAGITISTNHLDDGGLYSCVGINNNFESRQELIVHLLTETMNAPKPLIEDLSKGHVTGEKLHLKCYVLYDESTAINLEWFIPDEDGIAKGRIHKIPAKQITDHDELSAKLTAFSELIIDGLKETDEGRYTCQVKDHNNKVDSDSLDIKIAVEGTSFINLTESTNQYVFEVNSGKDQVQWKVLIDAYPTPKIQWFNNKKEPILSDDTLEGKYKIVNNKKETILKIKEIEIEDSGIYELRATNDRNETSKNFTLRVRGKPLVEIRDFDTYHLINQSAKLVCQSIAYPLAEISWFFKPESGKYRKRIDKKIYREKNETDILKTSNLNFIASEAGEISCEAKNMFGTDINTRRFLISDVQDGCHVWHSNDDQPIAIGDNLTLICGASFENRSDTFIWTYQENDSQPEIQLKKQYKLQNYKTKYSYRSNLTIEYVERKHAGIYECKNGLEHNTCYKITVSVKDPVPPSFINMKSNHTKIRKKMGENLDIDCSVQGIPAPKIIWKKNRERWNGDNSKHIIFDKKNELVTFKYTIQGDEGIYTCEARNRIGQTEKSVEVILEYSIKTNYALIIGVSILTIVLLFIVIYLAVKIRNEQKLRKELTIAGLNHFEEGAIESLNPELGIDDQAELLPYDKKWEFPRDKLKLGKQLGSGAFGVVMKAQAFGILEEEDVTTVAVKMVKRNADFIYIKALASELKIMVHLGKHLNVVNLLGACTKNVTKRELLVIVEFCRFGNLHNYLLRHRDNFIDQIDPITGNIDTSIGAEILLRTFSVSTTCSGRTDGPSSPLIPSGGADYRAENSGLRLNSNSSCTIEESISMTPSGDDVLIMSNSNIQPEWRSNYKGDYNGKVRPICTQDLLCWAFQVARGMEYLTSRRVLHGDLAARNILLSDNNIVKICDFGLAKSMYKSDNYRKKGDGPLPIKWMAVESIRDRVFSTQSDIWSYGIVLWEFFSLARTPYPGMEADERFYNKLVEGYRMEQPEYATKEIYQVMLECWHSRAIRRPSFGDLVERIGNSLEDTVRKHYIDLNSPYLNMNERVGESGHSDYLAMLSPPDYGNLVSPSNVYANTSQRSEDSSGYLCMRPPPSSSADIFSPKQSTAFNFDMEKSPKNSETEMIDLKPIQKNETSQEPDKEPAPCITNSFSNPSYQFVPKIKSEFENEAISNADNYINVPKYKNALKNEENLKSKSDMDPLAINHYVNDLIV